MYRGTSSEAIDSSGAGEASLDWAWADANGTHALKLKKSAAISDRLRRRKVVFIVFIPILYTFRL